jgi:hypothetical protein
VELCFRSARRCLVQEFHRPLLISVQFTGPVQLDELLNTIMLLLSAALDRMK